MTATTPRTVSSDDLALAAVRRVADALGLKLTHPEAAVATLTHFWAAGDNDQRALELALEAGTDQPWNSTSPRAARLRAAWAASQPATGHAQVSA